MNDIKRLIDVLIQAKVTWNACGIANYLVENDVVKVVRCKDCNFRGTEDCPMAYYLELEGDYVDPTKDYDFCSYGKRGDTNE